MSKALVDVTVDVNEPGEVTGAVADHPEVSDFSFSQLPAGDLLIGGLLVERKTPSDFSGSMTGRLDEQVEKMQQADVEKRIIAIEGDMSDFDSLRRGPPGKSLRGRVASLEARDGLSVVFCSDLPTLVDISIRMARKLEEPASRRSFDTVVGAEVPMMVRLFLQVEGVGPETAEKLAERFESVHDACVASPDELTEVDGVGSVTAEKVKEVFTDG